MVTRSLTRAGGLLAVALILAACSGGASTAPTTAPSTAPTTAASTGASEAPTASGPVALPTPEKTDVKVGLSGEWSTGNLHAALAKYVDLGKKYGLNVEYVIFSGGSKVVQALVAGQVDVSDNSGGPVVASLATDVPLEMTFISQFNLTDIMYSQKDVKTADDLRGKNVAISSFGSQSHAGALLALKSLGLTDKDVTITQVGGDSDRLAALKGGSVAASMNDAVREKELTDLGFNALVHLADVQGLGGVPRSSMTVTKEFAQKYPNTTLALTAMYKEGQKLWMANPDLAAEALASLAQMDPAEAKTQVTDVLKQKWSPEDGRCDATVMEFTKQVLVVANPDAASVDAQQACTNEFLDKLDSLGWKPDTTPPAM